MAFLSIPIFFKIAKMFIFLSRDFHELGREQTHFLSQNMMTTFDYV